MMWGYIHNKIYHLIAGIIPVAALLISLQLHAIPEQSNRLAASVNTNYGYMYLTPNLLKEPLEVHITSGGSIDAGYLGDSCAGFASQLPDYRIIWNGSLSTLHIKFESENGRKTTLIIQKPNGNWICNSFSADNEKYPSVLMDRPYDGVYNIWVGSYTFGEYTPGKLIINTKKN